MAIITPATMPTTHRSLQPPSATGMTGSSVLGRVETAAGEGGPCYKIQHFQSLACMIIIIIV